jgi:hypothetical protein
MGWVPHNPDVYPDRWIDPNGRKFVGSSNMPDPFTSADDDYAVLEWMRAKKAEAWDEWFSFMTLIEDEPWEYNVGDYARAALKVIK